MSTDVHTLIGAYAIDAVDPAERGRVERHLSECESCAAEEAELRETVWRLSDVTEAEPPAAMRERVLSRARRTRQEPPPERGSETPAPRTTHRRSPTVRRALALAAAALVIAFAGGMVTWIAMQRSTDTDPTESDRIAAVLEAPDAAVATRGADGGGQVTVVASETLDQAVVVMAELAQVADDRSYQVWLVDPTGQTSAGVMRPGTSSDTMLIDGLGDTEVIGVTNEPAGGSEAPTLPMVADVEVST